MLTDCEMNPEYRTSVEQKRRAQSAAQMRRKGVNFREQIREKFRSHIREARQEKFAEQRGPLGALAIKEILRRQIGQIATDVGIEKEIASDLLEEMSAAQIEEFERDELYLISISEDDDLLCPVCQKQPMQMVHGLVFGTPNRFQCECETAFNFVGSKDDLRMELRSVINNHELECLQPLNFFVEPPPAAPYTLSAICSACEFFHSI